MLTRSGLTGLRPHDVRRSVGSWLSAAGLTSNQVGALLNHKSNVTSKVYVQLGDDEATKAAAAKTQAALVQSFGGNVTSIESRAREGAHEIERRRISSNRANTPSKRLIRESAQGAQREMRKNTHVCARVRAFLHSVSRLCRHGSA